MNSSKAQKHPGKFMITLFGNKPDLTNKIKSAILQGDSAVTTYYEVTENDSFKIISSLNFFEECHHPDQKTIDFMAHSDAGPHRFVLAIDSENTTEDKVMDQINKLQNTFGENATKNVVVILENQDGRNSLNQLKEMHNFQIITLYKDLASELREGPLKHQHQKKELERTSDKFHQKNSPETIGIRSQKTLTAPAQKAPEHDTGGSPQSLPETVFNIVLLGKSGTGKSASGNTILASGNSQHSIVTALVAGTSRFSMQDTSPEFKSYPSSTPVTTKCEVRMMKAGMQVRVVDTPDFFYKEEDVDRVQVEECKKYCQEEDCVVLLVIQLGRFTDGERGILEKLEENLGWRIREKTIVLFTHGDDLNVKVEKFIGERSHLKHIVEACGNRYHVFKNTSRDSKQVMALTEKFSEIFPHFTAKSSTKHPLSECCLC